MRPRRVVSRGQLIVGVLSVLAGLTLAIIAVVLRSRLQPVPGILIGFLLIVNGVLRLLFVARRRGRASDGRG